MYARPRHISTPWSAVLGCLCLSMLVATSGCKSKQPADRAHGDHLGEAMPLAAGMCVPVSIYVAPVYGGQPALATVRTHDCANGTMVTLTYTDASSALNGSPPATAPVHNNRATFTLQTKVTDVHRYVTVSAAATYGAPATGTLVVMPSRAAPR